MYVAMLSNLLYCLFFAPQMRSEGFACVWGDGGIEGIFGLRGQFRAGDALIGALLGTGKKIQEKIIQDVLFVCV